MEAFNHRATEPIWSSIPTELLLVELSKRDDANQRPQCGSKERGTYHMGLHVFALFLVLILSAGSCAIPLISRRTASKPGGKRKTILFYCQHFGTGVLMATAFVHLLPTAFISLTDPCLPHVFSVGFRPMAGLVAMVAALSVAALESWLTTHGVSHSHSHEMFDDSDNEDGAHEGLFSGHTDGTVDRRGYGLATNDIELRDNESTHRLVANASPLPQSTPTLTPTKPLPRITGGDGYDDDDDDLEEGLILSENELRRRSHEDCHGTGRNLNPTSSKLDSGSRQAPEATGQLTEEERKKLEMQCLLLEAGILFHSVFIGMALSVATGPNFIVFLIAIAFHQSFEGVALGSRIVAIQHPRSSWRPWGMVLAFGVTTPIGQLIGLIAHEFYDPMSQTGLLMVGFMNAISSGLLLFAGLVQLLSQDFLSDKSYKTLRGKRRTYAYSAVVAGSLLMAGVGAIA